MNTSLFNMSEARNAFWRGRRVLVTGGAGFIGGHLVRRLAQWGARLRVVDNCSRPSVMPPADVEFWQRDLLDAAVSREACRDMDTVFHLAAEVGGIGYYLARSGDVLRRNTLIDALVLDAALDASVPRFFYASSAHVYPKSKQNTPDAPALREEDALPADPPLSYGWAKLIGEQEILGACRNGKPTRAAIFRLVGAYGEGQDIDIERGSVIPVMARRIIEYGGSRPFMVRGTGMETRSYCYVGDVVDAIVRGVEILDERNSIGPLNVGRDEVIRIADIIQLIADISGKRIPIEYDPSVPTTIWGQRVDCSQARAVLSWEPAVSLVEGLRRVYVDVEARLAPRANAA